MPHGGTRRLPPALFAAASALSPLLLLPTLPHAARAASAVAVNPAQRTGVQATGEWAPWPDAPQFAGWNESCAGPASSVPPYLRCDRMVLPPASLERHTAVAVQAPHTHERLVLLFGGRAGRPGRPSAPQLSNALYALHVRLGTFFAFHNATDDPPEAAAALPAERHSHAAFSAVDVSGEEGEAEATGNGGGPPPHTVMYVHGGFASSGEPLGDLWAFRNFTWEQVGGSTGTAGAPRLGGHTAVQKDGRAYVYGGYGPGGVLNRDVWVLDLRNETWTVLPTPGVGSGGPAGRAYHTAVLLPAAWTSPPHSVHTPSLPRTSSVHDAAFEQHLAASADQMVVLGGLAPGTSGEHVASDELWVFSLVDESWTRRQPQAGGYLKRGSNQMEKGFPVQPRQGHACVAALHRMVCYGGWDQAGAGYVDLVEYDLALNRLFALGTSASFSGTFPAKLAHSAAVFVRTDNVYAPSYQLYVAGGAIQGTTLPPAPLYAAAYAPPLCAAGTFSPDGDWMCFPCPSGFASRPYTCTECEAGSYSSVTRQNCTLCPPGSYAPSNGTASVAGCLPCPSGTELPAGGGVSAADCAPCPVGTYTNATGTGECERCPAGTKGVLQGAAALWEGCEACPAGHSSVAGSSVCAVCPAGTQAVPMVQRMWPFALMIESWGQLASGCSTACVSSCVTLDVASRCATCPSLICGSCGPTPAATYAVRAGEPVFFRVTAFDTGLVGTAATAPVGMQRLGDTHNFMRHSSPVVTVETEEGTGGGGLMGYSCTTDYPNACGSVAAGVTATADTGTHQCGTSSVNTFLFSLRFDTVSPLTRLVFRSEALLPARIAFTVGGTNVTVLSEPPAYAVHTVAFAVKVGWTDAFGNVDTTESALSVTVAAPRCYAYANNTVADTMLSAEVYVAVNGGTASTTAQTSVAQFSSGVAELSLAFSGVTWGEGLPAHAKVLCHVRIQSASDSAAVADTTTFFVQQPHHVSVSHSSLTYTGQPLKVGASVRDAEDSVVQGDAATRLRLEALRLKNTPQSVNDTLLFLKSQERGSRNASLLAARGGGGFVKRVASGQVDFYVSIDFPSSAILKVGPADAAPFQSIPLLYETVFVESGAALATRLALSDSTAHPLLDPFPTVIVGNTTVRVGVDAVDDSGNHDFTAEYTVGVNLTGCTAASVWFKEGNDTRSSRGASTDTRVDNSNGVTSFRGVVNDGLPYFTLSRGSGVVELLVSSESLEADACALYFYHIPSARDPDDILSGNRTVAAFSAPTFQIRNPKSLDPQWDIPRCNATSCVDCRVPLERTKVKVFLLTQSGVPVTWLSQDSTLNPEQHSRLYVNMTVLGLEYSDADSSALLLEGSGDQKHVGPGDTGVGRSVASPVDHATGAAEFYFTPLVPLNSTFSFVFQAGYLRAVRELNTTYVIGEGIGVFTEIVEHLRTVDVVETFGFVDEAATCGLTTGVFASKLAFVAPHLDVWISGGDVTLYVEAQDAFGQVDTDVNGFFTVTPRNCEGGLHTAPAFLVSNSTPTSSPPNVLTVVLPIGSGRATVTLHGILPAMHFEHDVSHMTLRGAKDCELRLAMTPPPSGLLSLTGRGEPFELIRLADSCTPCGVGWYSTGGSGDLTGYWSGGCEPCPAGTYGTLERAASVSECEVCPAGYGYDSTQSWDSTLFKSEMESLTACTACPSGSTSAGQMQGGGCASLSSSTPTAALGGGRTGRQCTAARCTGCSAGYYFFQCSGYTSAATCAAADNALCAWATTPPSARCVFADPAKEPSTCVACAAGTVQTSSNNYNGVASCYACARGTYSANEAHSTATYGFRSNAHGYVYHCHGTGAGNCDAGEYGPTTGMTAASQCVGCPPGYWSALLGVATAGGSSFGPSHCYPCPPGTYSGAWRATSVATCVECPPGSYCPAGASEPVPADVYASLLKKALAGQTAGVQQPLLDTALALYPETEIGHVPTAAYGLGGSVEPVYCDVRGGVGGTDDAGGWVRDGRFTDKYWLSQADIFGPAGTETGYVDYWTGAAITNTYDHSSEYSSMATMCADVGGGASYYNATHQRFYCCASACTTANGGLGCGTTAACVDGSSLKGSCCPVDIDAAQKTCGRVTSSVPCFLDGPSADSYSGSAVLNATYDTSPEQKIALSLVNTGPLYARVWGKGDTMTGTDTVFGIKVHVYESQADFDAGAANITVQVNVAESSRGASGWHLGEQAFRVPHLESIYGVGVQLFTTGGYLGAVYLDDVSLRVDPMVACNCSLGYFYNDSRLGNPDFDTPCQRCPRGSMCHGGIQRVCAGGGLMQGGHHTCTACRSGWICDYDGRGSATPCPSHTYEVPVLADFSVCKPCGLGYACRDGLRESCRGGTYGDGAKECTLCLPGFYSTDSLADIVAMGIPEIEGWDSRANETASQKKFSFTSTDLEVNLRCDKCPPGYESLHMRTVCRRCEEHTYSPDGDVCRTCPVYEFATGLANAACQGCFAAETLPGVTIDLPKNAVSKAVTLLPLRCIDMSVSWRVVRHRHLNTSAEGGFMVEVSWRREMVQGTLSVAFTPRGDVLGEEQIEFVVQRWDARTSVPGKEQLVVATVKVANRAPTAHGDSVTVSHPQGASRDVALNTLWQNDVDPDGDELFLADDVFFSGHPVGAFGLSAADARVSPYDRGSLIVTLPAGFTGPMLTLNYRVMDQELTVATCVAPHCQLSNYAQVTIVAMTAPPLAVDDTFEVLPGGTTLLDVLANDVDPDGDILTVCLFAF